MTSKNIRPLVATTIFGLAAAGVSAAFAVLRNKSDNRQSRPVPKAE